MGEQGETHNAFYGQVLEDRHHHFCPVVLVRKGSLSTVCSEAGGFTKVYLLKEYQRIPGHIIKPPHLSN